MQQKRKLIIFKSNRNLAESIAKNKNLNIYKRVKELGFEPEKVDMPYSFRYFYNHLFKLTPHLSGMLPPSRKRLRTSKAERP